MRLWAQQRENVVVATKFGMDMQGANGPDWGVRGSRRYVRNGGRGEPAASRHGLDRPLPAAPSRPAHADRRDARRARRARARGQGALHRQQQPHRLAGRRRRLDRPCRRHRALRLGAERVLPPRARRRGRARARLRARRRRAAALLPARLGPADRQVPPRRGGARGHPPRVDGRAARRGGLGHHRAPRGVCRRARSAPPSTWPSAGSRPSRRWPRSSRGPPGPSRCATTCGPGSWQPTVSDLAALDEITIPAILSARTRAPLTRRRQVSSVARRGRAPTRSVRHSAGRASRGFARLSARRAWR